MFLPTTKQELDQLGWDTLDVILITGDSYIDSPHIGVAVIGKVLLNAGFRVGIIAQPDITSNQDIARLGEPTLFWGVTGGCIDSMVANRTTGGKKRKRDDYTPGGMNNRRPDRAVVVYSNLIRQYFKKTRPIVLGGIEASLRRIAHYDYWTDRIRRSILFDAKADYLIYGMADRSVVNLANFIKTGKPPQTIRGLCYISKEKHGAVLNSRRSTRWKRTTMRLPACFTPFTGTTIPNPPKPWPNCRTLATSSRILRLSICPNQNWMQCTSLSMNGRSIPFTNGMATSKHCTRFDLQ